MSTVAHLNPWLGMPAVAVSMLAWMLGLRVLQRQCALDPETARKLFHLGGGVLALSLPWLFQESWPVLLLTAVTLGAFAALRRIPALARGPGQILHAVSRQSHGEFYFPLGVCLVFLLTGGARVAYPPGDISITSRLAAGNPANLFQDLDGKRGVAMVKGKGEGGPPTTDILLEFPLFLLERRWGGSQGLAGEVPVHPCLHPGCCCGR